MLNRIANIPWMITKWVLMVGVLVMLVYLGACVYANFFDRPEGQVEVPDTKIVVRIEATGRELFTHQVEEYSDRVVLKGFWQLENGKYRYYDDDMILFKKFFGEITIFRR